MQTAVIFPRMEARNLEGRTFKLPADFEGERNVVIVAFERWQQELVDTWMPFLNRLMAKDPGLRVYEIPVISWMYAPARFVIDGGMTAGIPNKTVREHTLTVYTDVRQVLRALDLPNSRTIAILLVDRTGNILWRELGAYAEKQGEALKQALDFGF